MQLLLIVHNPEDLKLGLIITIVGIVVVFAALMVLNLVFRQIPKILKIQVKRKTLRKRGPDQAENCCPEISSGTTTAIALALYLLFDESHDKESSVMTIEKVSKRYSPWNSKIYGLRNLNFNNQI